MAKKPSRADKMYGKSPKIRAADEKAAAPAKDEPPQKVAAKAAEPSDDDRVAEQVGKDTDAIQKGRAGAAQEVGQELPGGPGADPGIPLADVHVRESKSLHTRHQQEYAAMLRRHAKETAPAPAAEDGAGEAGDTIDKAA